MESHEMSEFDRDTSPLMEQPDSPRSSSSSLFDNIYDRSDKTDDFYSNALFHNVLQRYNRSGTIARRVCGALFVVLAVLWALGLVVYSRKAVSVRTGAFVASSGSNITLSPFSASYANITMEKVRRGTYTPFREEIHWLSPAQYPENGSGFYLGRTRKGGYEVRSVDDPEYSYLLFETPQFAYENTFLYIQEVVLNPAQRVDDPLATHMVVTDRVKGFRHSSSALYWMCSQNVFRPVQRKQEQDSLELLNFVRFSPNGKRLVFSVENNLYVGTTQSLESVQITDGSESVFNGRSDWVYEEEIIEGDSMVWWSPDSERLVYAKLDDGKVGEYNLDYYTKQQRKREEGEQKNVREEEREQKNSREEEKLRDREGETENNVLLYPLHKTIKYPKPGTPNPVVSLHEYTISDQSLKDISIPPQSLLYGAFFVGSTFVFKYTDRPSRILTRCAYTDQVKVLSTQNASDYNGWIDKQEEVVLVNATHYIDRIVHRNQSHLALFSTNADPSLLTDSADWGVVEKTSVGYDSDTQTVHFLSTRRSGMDAHWSAVGLDGALRDITPIDADGKYAVDWSPNGKYASVMYLGPDQPWQRIVNVGRVLSEDPFSALLESPVINHFDVTALAAKDTNFPTKVYREIPVDTYSNGEQVLVNMVEILPPNFDPHRKYPLLVHVYGGPGSQNVDKAYGMGFLEVASATLDMVVLVIDPRGTAGHGWRFRSFATDRIGYWEPRDVTEITQKYITANKFVDSSKTAVWGWSYGGFTTLKTLEYDQGNTFKYGMAVAPVTNWLFYDSVYTERYMRGPQENPNYESAKIKDYSAFKGVNRFLIMHGTADDNVHLQNSLWLLDKLNLEGVENYDSQFFPDSDHGISWHNGNVVVYDRLLEWMGREFRH